MALQIKCSEERPACQYCNKKSLPCEYGVQQLRWVTTTRTNKESTRNNKLDCSARPPEPVFNQSANDQTLAPATELLWTLPAMDDVYFHDLTDLDGAPSVFAEGSTSLTTEFNTWSQVEDDLYSLSEPDRMPHADGRIPLPDLEAWQQHSSWPFSTDFDFCNTKSQELDWSSLDQSQDINSMMTAAPIFDCPTSSQQLTRPPMGMLSDSTTSSVSFYFSSIGPLLSCSPQIENPFITDVANMWTSQSARSLPLVIQSMSLAFLASSTPSLSRKARELRQEAKEVLENELQRSLSERHNPSLELSLILLGASAGWLQPLDSMVDLFKKFSMLPHQFLPSNHTSPFSRGVSTYWQMFFTYMSASEPSLTRLGSMASHDALMSSIYLPPSSSTHLHPWTGDSADLIKLFTKVGQLVRHHEGTVGEMQQGPCTHIAHQCAARTLQERLLMYRTKGKRSSGNGASTNTQLSRLAKIYQAAALLQLYRVFPCLSGGSADQHNSSSPGSQLADEAGIDNKMVMMARHVIDLALETHGGSPILRFQFVPFAIACSELRIARPAFDNFGRVVLDTSTVATAQARVLAKNHLMVMRGVFPGDRIDQVDKIVSAMWARLDSHGSRDGSHWIKWLMDNGLDVV